MSMQWRQLRQRWLADHQGREKVDLVVTWGRWLCARRGPCRRAYQIQRFLTSHTGMSADNKLLSVSKCQRGGTVTRRVPPTWCTCLLHTMPLPVSCAVQHTIISADCWEDRFWHWAVSTVCQCCWTKLTLWHPLLPYGYSYKVSCARPGWAVICNFDIRALWRSGLRFECPDVKNYTWRLKPVQHSILCSCTHMATVGVISLRRVISVHSSWIRSVTIHNPVTPQLFVNKGNLPHRDLGLWQTRIKGQLDVLGLFVKCLLTLLLPLASIFVI